jgi:hypothetical protein
MHIFGVHMDRKATLANVERIVGEIRGMGRETHFFNMNAADEDNRREALDQMEKILKERGEEGGVKVLLHSLAFGTLKPFVAAILGEADGHDRGCHGTQSRLLGSGSGLARTDA